MRGYKTFNDTLLIIAECEDLKKAAIDSYISMRNVYFRNEKVLRLRADFAVAKSGVNGLIIFLLGDPFLLLDFEFGNEFCKC